MSDQLIDVRTLLAFSKDTRVEMGQDGALHVLVGPLTLHLDRLRCEELTMTLAMAMIAPARVQPSNLRPALALVRSAAQDTSRDPEARHRVR